MGVPQWALRVAIGVIIQHANSASYADRRPSWTVRTAQHRSAPGADTCVIVRSTTPRKASFVEKLHSAITPTRT